MKVFANIVAVLLVLVLAAGGVILLLKHRREPQRAQPQARPPLVETVVARRADHSVVVDATGVVVPDADVTIQPQVSGLVVEKHPELGTGGRLKAGDVLLKIDPRDYELAVEQRKADLARAEFELAVERGRQVIAKREWALLGQEMPPDDAGRRLALREPHLENAKAAIEAAEAALEQAKLNLERTTIEAPFDSLVISDFSEIGQLVSPGTPLARLIGADQCKVRISVPVDKLALIPIGGVNGVPEGQGAKVTIIQMADQRGRIVREGRITRLQGDLEPRGRLARLQAVVKDPFAFESGEGLPLLMDAYVRCEIQGVVLNDVVALPRRALREGETLWVAERDPAGAHRLDIRRDVSIALKGRETVYVREGVRDGERVVTSRVSVPSHGRAVRLESDAPAREESEGAP